MLFIYQSRKFRYFVSFNELLKNCMNNSKKGTMT